MLPCHRPFNGVNPALLVFVEIGSPAQVLGWLKGLFKVRLIWLLNGSE
jgi:hypothetical protein